MKKRLFLSLIAVAGVLAFCVGSIVYAEEFDPCGLLSDPEMRVQISGALELKLMLLCGEITEEEVDQLGREMRGDADVLPPFVFGEPGLDILINDPASDIGGTTQSETSIVAVNNTICAAWNDSGSDVLNVGFSGFGFSNDGGLTWTDGGAFPPGPGPDRHFGDPNLAYSVRDGAFYFAALSDLGLSLWKSTDGCQNFSYVRPIHVGIGDDKELMAIDNNPASPYFGRIYIGWTDFARSTNRNVTSYSEDGGCTWSTPAALPGSGTKGQGMWPAVAPNGDVYFALVDLALTQEGLQNQWIYLSINGGNTWVKMTDIGSNQRRPENLTASENCSRQALNGDIRNLSSPQIAIQPDPAGPARYVIHAVYAYDSDGTGPDESNVFYRRSTNGALTWSAEIMLNADGTTTDQWFPAIAVNSNGVVMASWYDRRLDPNNMNFDRYAGISTDAGLTWGPNIRISDVSSSVAQVNPNFDTLVRDCYHGDYDQVAIDATKAHILWSDDRRITDTGPNPDIYYDQFEHGGLIDPVVGTWRGTHRGDRALGRAQGPTRDLYFYPLGTFGPSQGTFTLNLQGSTAILAQGAWNRRETSVGTRKIRVGATEISNTDFNEAYGYTKFKVKGAALDQFVADFVNTWGGPPPTAQYTGKITGTRVSLFPTKTDTVEASQTASGM